MLLDLIPAIYLMKVIAKCSPSHDPKLGSSTQLRGCHVALLNEWHSSVGARDTTVLHNQFSICSVLCYMISHMSAARAVSSSIFEVFACVFALLSKAWSR